MTDNPSTAKVAIADLLAAGVAMTDNIIDEQKLENGEMIAPSVIVPQYYEIKRLPLQERDTPRRTKAEIIVADAESLVTYARRFGDSTGRGLLIQANPDTGTVVLHMDYDSSKVTSHREHRAQLSLRQSEEWKAWVQMSGERVSQKRLMEFLELRAADIMVPAFIDLEEAITQFEAASDGKFLSKVNRANGNISFTLEHGVKELSTVKLPQALELRLRPHVGSDAVGIKALIRYEIKEGKMLIGFDLVGTVEARRQDIERIHRDIRNELSAADFLAS